MVGCLRYRPLEPLANPEAAVRQSLERPIGSPPLSDLARDATVSLWPSATSPGRCRTRSCCRPSSRRWKQPVFPAARFSSSWPRACTAPTRAPSWSRCSVRCVAANYRIENHHGQARREHTFLGQSPRGVPVWIDSRYVQAELKITTGLIEPHFMAGFSGGRKLICPGLAALETIRTWHGPRFLEHANARNGCLDENPVHEENTAIARMAGCDFIVNVVIGETEKKNASLLARTG